MEVLPVHPGPASLELLLLQAEHRSSYVWDGQRFSQTFRARHIDDMWEFIGAHPLHPRIVRRLQDTGFYRIIEIGRLQFDWALITAMIELWRPETHTFHLPIGEATITLKDVEVLFGLPVDGLTVAYPHALREYTGLHYMQMLQRLTGYWLTSILPVRTADAITYRRESDIFARGWLAGYRSGFPDIEASPR
nr:serine/threonine-protein phosphatase 7 long form homolog [Nicotiana tomentosiformis]